MKRAIVAAFGLAAACAKPAPAEADPCAGAPKGEVSVRNAWVRPAAAGQTTTALYAIVCNRTGAPQALVSVAAEGVETVELHETARTPDGKVSMAKIDRLDVPTGGASALEPGAAHVMLIGLAGAVEEGSSVPVVFAFESGASVEAAATVRGEAAAAESEHSH